MIAYLTIIHSRRWQQQQDLPEGLIAPSQSDHDDGANGWKIKKVFGNELVSGAAVSPPAAQAALVSLECCWCGPSLYNASN